MNEELKKIEAKIKKLLSLSTSDNENEASIALRQAMKLMLKYNVTESDLSEDKLSVESYKSDYVKAPHFMRELYFGIASAFGVYAVLRQGYYDKKSTVFLSGQKSDVQRAMYMFRVAYSLVENKTQEYKSTRPYLSKTSTNDYRVGTAMGFISNLHSSFAQEEQLHNESSGKELVPVDSRCKLGKEFFNLEMDMKVEPSTDQVRHSIHAANGFQDGMQLQVNEGITNQGVKILGLTNEK